jgi:hypothetical protein
MTARCGSTDPTHRARQCKECVRLYNAAYKSGLRFARVAFGRNPAQCVVCGLTAGNSMNVKVRRYPLLRSYNKPDRRRASFVLGSIGLCDRCIVESAELKPQYRRAA